ncbi:MAG: CinA family protein [Phycisphaerales bacterium]
MRFPDPIPQLVDRLASDLCDRGLRVVTVESCTGGLLGGAFTSHAGISDGYIGGFITYSNDLKIKCVGVSEETLERWGAVSGHTAIEMAEGGREHTGADLAIAITGIAGPDGGSEEKPVGTVWIAVASTEWNDCRRFLFPGDRHEVRERSVAASLKLAIQAIRGDREPLDHEQQSQSA